MTSNAITNNNTTVYTAMSGGVDSSVAAYLLKEKGYNMVGVFMRCVNVDGCQERDMQDARRVAAHLGIPFHVWDFEDAYREKVVEYMIAGYRRGETPNPDIMCNKEIKFGLFFARAMKEGADFIATGHYVRKGGIAGTPAIQAGVDEGKDQSYFLWTLDPDIIKKSLFPVGHYQKTEIRKIAEQAGLPTAHKKDSQGICFLGQVDLSDFLSKYIAQKDGKVINAEGEVIGTHSGAAFYTIGQRHGFDVRTNSPQAAPHYVAEKDVAANTLVVAEGRQNPKLFKKEVRLKDVLVHPQLAGREKVLVQARIRYRQPFARATWHPRDKKLVFKKPVEFVAGGQSAVCYDDAGNVIGGGVIVDGD